MKKHYLSIGTLAVVVASTVAVVSCGTTFETTAKKGTDPNTHLLVEYLNANNFTATQGENTSET